MLAAFLGAGFSTWAAGLPTAADLFDYAIRPRNNREGRRVELVAEDKRRWDVDHPGEPGERFIEWSLDGSERRAKRVVWYVTRRLTDPFLGRTWAGEQAFMIDDKRARAHEGVVRAQRFLTRFIGADSAGLITCNYDLLVEYALGSRLLNYGVAREHLVGRGSNPIFFSQGTPIVLRGSVTLAKVHGSVSWDDEYRYTDGRCGLNGKALIVPPRPGKSMPPQLERDWAAARNILGKTTHLVVFGFAFNAYDQQLLQLLSSAASRVRRVLLIDIAPQVDAARELWPSAEVVTSIPTVDTAITDEHFFEQFRQEAAQLTP